jgi:hypothetical protein
VRKTLLKRSITLQPSDGRIALCGVTLPHKNVELADSHRVERSMQPLAGAFQEQRHQVLEVRWLPPRPDDRSRAVDLGPGE